MVGGPASFVALGRVRFLGEAVDVAGAADIPAALARPQPRRSSGVPTPGRGLRLRLTLSGRGPAGAALRRLGPEVLLQRLREEAQGREPFLWWEALRLRTAGEHDRAALAGQGAAFLAAAWAVVAPAARQAGMGEPEGEAAQALLAEAERRCLGLLLPPQGQDAPRVARRRLRALPDFAVREFGPGLTILAGPNEAGTCHPETVARLRAAAPACRVATLPTRPGGEGGAEAAAAVEP